MHNRKKWIKRLEMAESEHRFANGYKLVFGPWRSLEGLDTAFLSTMPGLPVPEGTDLRLISEERGNLFKIGFDGDKRRVSYQFLELAKLIKRKPNKIMTGAATPFRVRNWASLKDVQEQIALSLGRKFWKKPLKQRSIKLIIVTGNVARDMVVDITGANIDKRIPSGWGNVELVRYKAGKGKSIVHLPDLSRFKLLSREECRKPLKKIFKGCLD